MLNDPAEDWPADPSAPSLLLPARFTIATAAVPAGGVARHCTAATACPHTVLAKDAEQARLMLADHYHSAHGVRPDWKEMGR